MKIRKDDNVIVVSGKDKGKTGKVVKSFPKDNTVVVAGVNLRKVHSRPRKSNQKGQIVDKTMPIHISNVMIVDPKTNKPSRIGSKTDGKKKVRVSKRSGATL